MKAVIRPALLLALLATTTALAPARAEAQSVRIKSSGADGEVEAGFADRFRLQEADAAVVTRKRDFALLIVGDQVALQLTDRGLREVVEHMEKEQEAKEGAGSRIFTKALLGIMKGGVRFMLDRSMVVPVSEIESVEYTDGRLRFIAVGGGEIFEEFDINGRDALADFSPREAREFIREFERAKRRN